MPRLLDHTGTAYLQASLKSPQTADMRLLHQSFAEHPAKGLTPQRLNSILLEAEQGDWTRQYELFNDMEQRCPHLFSEMQKLKRAIGSLEWEVQPPRDATPAEEKETLELRDMLYEVHDIESVFFDLLDAQGKYFSAVEYFWDTSAGQYLPTGFCHRPQTWFRVDRETRRELRLRDVSALDGLPLNPTNWIIHTVAGRSGYPAEAAMYRSLVLPFLFLMYASRDWAEFLEIHGLPIRIGKYPSQSTPQEKTTLLRAVTEMGHRAAGIMPTEMEFELHQAVDASSDPFIAMIKWAENCISKVIVGGTLVSQADGKTSTNAQGSLHADDFHHIIEAGAAGLESTLLRQLIAPMMLLNFGKRPLSRMPWIKFDTRIKEDFTAWATALPQLLGAGLEIPERWAREKLNIPEARDGEKLLTPQFVAVSPASSSNDPNAAPPVPTPAPAPAATKPAAPNAKTKQAAAATLGALLNLPGVVALKAIAGSAPDPDNPTDPYTDQIAATSAVTVEGWITKLRAITQRAAAQGQSLESLKSEFLHAFGDLDGAELEQAMGLAMATADLAGQLAVKQRTVLSPLPGGEG
jgi:phage gp29-like protein